MQDERYTGDAADQGPSAWDHEDARRISVPRWLIVELGPRDAIVFAQILWWWRPSERGAAHRSRQVVENGGHVWLHTTDAALGDDVGLGVDQVRRSRVVLVERGLIECRSTLVRGVKQTLIRVVDRPVDPAFLPEPPADLPDLETADLPDPPLYAKRVTETRGKTPGTDLAVVAPPPGITWKIPKIVSESGSLPDALSLCDLLAEKLTAREIRAAPRSKAWVEPMEALLRIDGVEAERVRRCIGWLDAGQGRNASFWRNNILSPDKLRAQWGRLVEAAREDAAGPRSRDHDRISGIAHVTTSDLTQAIREARPAAAAPDDFIDTTATEAT